MTKTFVNVERKSETTKEDKITFTSGAYEVEVHHINDKLSYIWFEEQDDTQNFKRRFGDPQELLVIRNLFTAVLIEMGVDADHDYHFEEVENDPI
jgi:hypothetical protein